LKIRTVTPFEPNQSGT